MRHSLNARRSAALTAALVVATWSAAAPATADPGGQSAKHGHSHAKAHSSGQAKGRANGHTQGQGGHHATSQQPTHDHGKPQGAGSHASHGAHGTRGSSHGGGAGDPAGNNGTVKIAPLGAMDSIPNNTPHVGCSFQVEWYGYDQGADIVSTVSFAMWAPTKDVGLTVHGPGSVFVGGDPASGAGTSTGLDGRQAYTLSFDGAPQAQQGYHVKLTVATPRSQGNDTKTKVFWVQPCASSPGTGTGSGTGTGTGTGGGSGSATGTHTGSDSGTASSHGNGTDVLGAQLAANGNGNGGSADRAGSDRAGSGGSVPTAVEAGEAGRSTLADVARSPWPLGLVGAGLMIALATLAQRRRAGSDS